MSGTTEGAEGVGGEEETPRRDPAVARLARAASGTATRNTLSLEPLFFRGLFRDPITQAPRPLPPHRWTMIVTMSPSDAAIMSAGDESDADGISMVVPSDEATNPALNWVLRWNPIFDATPGGVPMVEAWVDLDANEWVAAPDPIEKRRLVRLVPWISNRKAGGLEPSSLAKRFQRGGVIQGVELPVLRQTFGRRGAPWDIVVDYAWFQTYLSMRYYDVRQRASAPVPPGLMVEAHDEHGTRIGGGVSVGETGLVYVLHQRTQEETDHVDYTFSTPTNTAVELGLELAERVKEAAATTVRTHYRLPERWHSFGMEGRLSHGQRLQWEKPPSSPHAEDGLADEPIMAATTRPMGPHLVFHLDDTLLVDGHRSPVAFAKKTPVIALDHQLVTRSPMFAMPHVSSRLLDRNYLPAEEFIVQEGVPEWGLTRIVEHQGILHDLRETRVDGPLRKTPAVGARHAVASDHPIVDYSSSGHPRLKAGRYELHLVDTLIDDYRYGDVRMRLFHLVVYMTYFAHKGDTSDDEARRVLAHLDAAAQRWSPGHPSAPGTKPYALVAESGVREGEPIVLVRYLFSHLLAPKPGKGTILLHRKTRAQFRADANTVDLQAGDQKPRDLVKFDVEGIRAARFVMAHELGHATGLPDEYIEDSSKAPLPQFSQVELDGGPARPFARDGGLMANDLFPRLRYLWHHAYSLRKEPAFAAPLGGSYCAEYPGFPLGTLKYRLPPLVPTILANEREVDPWTPVARRALARGELLLYRLGADEGAAGGLFPVLRDSDDMPMQRTPHLPLDGLLIIRSNILFRAGANFKGSVLKAAKSLYGKMFFPPSAHGGVLVTAGPSLLLRRILVDFQPRFALGSASSTPDLELTLMDPADGFESDLLRVKQPHDKSWRILADDVGTSVFRLVLDLPTTLLDDSRSPRVNNGPIVGVELARSRLQSDLRSMLGDPVGSDRTFVDLEFPS